MTPNQLSRKVLETLNQLNKSGTVLAMASGMETAVVVRERKDLNDQTSTVNVMSIPSFVAEHMMNQEYITPTVNPGRVVRLVISPEGRQAIPRLTADQENLASSLTEKSPDEVPMNMRYVADDSPIVGLARRRGPDGNHFLSPEEVAAGDRFREDFQLSETDKFIAENWAEQLLDTEVPAGVVMARSRLLGVLNDLGPDLAELTITVLGLNQGLEKTEKDFGWSARSAKIVLRIALRRMITYYDQNPNALIG